MEENRLDKIYRRYIVTISIFSFLVFISFIYVISYDYEEYCDYQVGDGFYHFLIEGKDPCLIRWKPLLLQPLIASVAVFLLFTAPAFILLLIAKFYKEKPWRKID